MTVVVLAVAIDLTDDHGLGVLEENNLTSAISDADAEIDSYCQAHYSVPLDPVPDRITQLSADIAIYNLYSRRVDVVPEVREKRYNAAIRFLEKVAEGKLPLGADTPAATTTADTVDVEYNDRIFTRDKMSGF